MRTTIARLMLLPLLLAGCQQAAAAPTAATPSAAAPAPQNAPKRPTVGVLVFDGVQVIDYSAPFEVFGQAGYDVFTVAERKAAVTTAMDQVIVPRHSFADAPPLDILVVPGGIPTAVGAAQDDPEVLTFVRGAQPRARHIMSVCNGAFILAKAGLLDGKGATTFHGLLGELQALVPTARVVNDRRFVDNGQIITTAGLTAGLDGALHVLEKELGTGMAQTVALGLEYDWRPEENYARAKLADMVIMRALQGSKLPRLVATGDMRIESYAGDERTWTMAMTIRNQGDAAAVMGQVASDLGAAGWKAAVEKADERQWRFTDDAGRAWKGTTTASEAAGSVRLQIHVVLGS